MSSFGVACYAWHVTFLWRNHPFVAPVSSKAFNVAVNSPVAATARVAHRVAVSKICVCQLPKARQVCASSERTGVSIGSKRCRYVQEDASGSERLLPEPCHRALSATCCPCFPYFPWTSSSKAVRNQVNEDPTSIHSIAPAWTSSDLTHRM